MNPNIVGVESDEDIMLDIFTDILNHDNSFHFVRINPELDNSAIEKKHNSYSPKQKKIYQNGKNATLNIVQKKCHHH